MKQLTLLLTALAVSTLAHAAPAPEKLLPQDTLAFVTVPEYAQTCKVYEQAPGYKLWLDPAMKPFKDKLAAKFTKDVLDPLEKELGIKFADYSGLAQGQFTLAITAGEWAGKKDQTPEFLLLMDSREKSDQLKKTLADLKKKWVDGGKQIKTDKIRNIEFTTLILMSDDIKNVFDKVFPDPNEGWESLSPAPKSGRSKNRPKAENKKVEFIIGQSDSLLVASSSAKEIEKILSLQSSGGVKPLAEAAHYQADHNALFRKSQVYGWVNLKTIIEIALKSLAADPPPRNQNNPMAMDPKTVISALGVGNLKSAAFALQEGNGGTYMQLFLGAAEADRKGLLKMLVADAKDAGPPPFVPADAVKFTRWRLSFPKAWDTLEQTLNDMNPALLGTLGFFEQALRQQDPNFSVKKSLIGNLGDDLITYEKNPRETTLEGLSAAPTMILLGSPNAEQLAATVKTMAGIAPMGGGQGGGAPKIKEREFQGRKIYSFPPMPKFNLQGQRTGERTLSFCANAGYVAISFDTGLMEEYLRSAGNPGKPFRATPGLADAAEKVGGMNTGLFGCENQAETMRVLLEVLKKDGSSFGDLLAMTPFGARLGFGENSKVFKDWFDFSLLPSYDKISKYFGLTVYGGGANADGISLKVYTPYPPQFK
jgi:hypothetical protein